MSISLICSCGARLEVDPKFAGQTIACPDCSKPLAVTPPPPPPKRVSGLALSSLLLAIIGAFTVIGSLVAIALGAFAYRRIPKQPGVTGQSYAKAGMILGGIFTALALVAYNLGDLAGIDSLLRRYTWAGKLSFPSELAVVKSTTLRSCFLRRPAPRWGVVELPPSAGPADRVMLVDVTHDAHVLWLFYDAMHPEEDAFNQRAKAVDLFRRSALVQMIGKLPAEVEEPEGGFKERDVQEGEKEQTFLFDIPLGGVPRTFLFRLIPDVGHLNIVVGGARTQRFEAVKDELQAALDSFGKEEQTKEANP
jgi:DNA-directed RNA polymerase subunit RPC12/RpoP